MSGIDSIAPVAVGQLHHLRAGEMRATLAPGTGGSVAAFYRSWHDGGGERRMHWLRPAGQVAVASGNPLTMASFPMLPFCNRIQDGRAQFEGRPIRMRPNHPDGKSLHPLHGIGWQRPWVVLAASATAASLGLDVTASAEWPWSFSARQQIELSDSRLRLTAVLTNTDTQAMPAGIGHHPYFPRTEGTRLKTTTDGMWQTNAEVMPTVLSRGSAIGQLARGADLAQLHLDNNFTGWRRHALIEWPADAHGPVRRLTMTAQPPLDYFVVYSPQGADHFCAEPVSQCTDWLNLANTHPALSRGGARLAPGESLSACIELTPSWNRL